MCRRETSPRAGVTRDVGGHHARIERVPDRLVDRAGHAHRGFSHGDRMNLSLVPQRVADRFEAFGRGAARVHG